MTVFEPEWDDETPDEAETVGVAPVMAKPEAIVVGVDPLDPAGPATTHGDGGLA
jgi:hypothetical protein